MVKMSSTNAIEIIMIISKLKRERREGVREKRTTSSARLKFRLISIDM